MRPDKALNVALAQWRQWGLADPDQPEVIDLLNAGATNRSYLLGTSNARYVLRLSGSQNAYGFDRDAERRLQNHMAQLRIAPAVHYQHNDNSYRVTEFLPGETLATGPTLAHTELAALVELVQRYQRTELELPALSYAAQLQQYWALTQNPVKAGMAERYAAELQRAREFEANNRNRRALCHHDLNPGNILRLAAPASRPAFALLDWEFAGYGIASMDLAILSVELKVDIETLAQLGNIPCAQLQAAAAVYRFMCELYSLAVPQ